MKKDKRIRNPKIGSQFNWVASGLTGFEIQDLRRKQERMKTKASCRRVDNEKNRTRDRVKTLKYQPICDNFKKTQRKKGKGKDLKIKGEVRKALVDTNSSCTKSWTRIGYGADKPLKEGFKHSCIFIYT